LHNITVYAKDTFENMGTSETTYFTVEVVEPFPTALVAAATVPLAAFVAVIIFYFKKRSR
jgi:hypothetical protein